MKSLQLVTPAQVCLFNCPYCVSKTRNVSFPNIVESDYPLYRKRLSALLQEYPDLSCVVITGTNDPSQSPEYVKKISALIKRERPDIQVELQTRKYQGLKDLAANIDVIAYSIDQYESLGKPEVLTGLINRYTIILTASFNGKRLLTDILAKVPPGVSQLTFKVLYQGNQASKAFENDQAQEINAWIAANSLDNETLTSLENDIKALTDSPFSLFFDRSCMEAEGRYQVFREDGGLYQNWDSQQALNSAEVK